MITKLVEYLTSKIRDPLPGDQAHRIMAVTGRMQIRTPDHARHAAIMICLYPKDGEIRLAYIKRKAHPLDLHRGQISFPGGKMEQEDRSLLETAIRETSEEIGVDVPKDQIIGKLSPLYIPVSNFYVQPYIGFLTGTPSFLPEPKEIDEIIESPLDWLSSQEVKVFEKFEVQDRYVLQNVPYYDLHGHILWGATAMITAEFLQLLESWEA